MRLARCLCSQALQLALSAHLSASGCRQALRMKPTRRSSRPMSAGRSGALLPPPPPLPPPALSFLAALASAAGAAAASAAPLPPPLAPLPLPLASLLLPLAGGAAAAAAALLAAAAVRSAWLPANRARSCATSSSVIFLQYSSTAAAQRKGRSSQCVASKPWPHGGAGVLERRFCLAAPPLPRLATSPIPRCRSAPEERRGLGGADRVTPGQQLGGVGRRLDQIVR
jgi:hypothetical protein